MGQGLVDIVVMEALHSILSHDPRLISARHNRAIKFDMSKVMTRLVGIF